jgi:hypothetical protein
MAAPYRPTQQALCADCRRDHIFLSKAWAEASIVFTHARLKDSGIEGLAKDAIEVAFWQDQVEGIGEVGNKGDWLLIRGEKWSVDEVATKQNGGPVDEQ